jgi:hypothetical protein
MWAAAALPVYSNDRGARRKAPKTAALLPSSQHNSITDLLEPAIDGPPSPESIRALNKQMKRTSFREKHQSQRTTSSGSSSLRSLVSDQPSWDDGVGLSRKSSARSTASSQQPRDRPESVQFFGKTIFTRRSRVKRDSGAQSSSGSSMYSAEMPLDTGKPPTSAPSLPALFHRRRPLKPDAVAEESTVRRKFQISEPYNFQHLTHTRREHVPSLQHGSRNALQSDYSAMRASQLPTVGALRGIEAENLCFANFSSEALPLAEDADAGGSAGRQSRLNSVQFGLSEGRPSPPRGLKHSRSQEVLRLPPPRPPRSPDAAPFLVSPPVPPPRISSRVSIRYGGLDPLSSTPLDRPRTSGGFRHPAPMSIAGADDLPPIRGHSYSLSSDSELPANHRYSRMIAASTDDINWPLTSKTAPNFDKALPDVPEEEEFFHQARKSRVSVVSNNSSLRGSQSVPLLRQVAQSHAQGPQRPLSGGSDTLGRMDLLITQRALRAGIHGGDKPDTPPQDSWEDDIDYCYEHEAEADCEYAWDRPSLDLSRNEDIATPVEVRVAAHQKAIDASPLLDSGHLDVPALSPVSQVSSCTASEALTPTAAVVPGSQFSLPRSAGRQPRQLLHVRTASHASSFKESHGFTLSPSLLIPGSDYHRHMIENEEDDRVSYEEFPMYEDTTITLGSSTALAHTRTSASTVGSHESANSSSERHVSTASASTDATRLTDVDPIAPKSDAIGQPNTLPELDAFHMRGKSEPMAVLLEEHPQSPVIHRNFSRNSEPKTLPNLKDDGTAKYAKPKDSAFFRRQRAKTSTPPPSSPLFPAL